MVRMRLLCCCCERPGNNTERDRMLRRCCCLAVHNNITTVASAPFRPFPQAHQETNVTSQDVASFCPSLRCATATTAVCQPKLPDTNSSLPFDSSAMRRTHSLWRRKPRRDMPRASVSSQLISCLVSTPVKTSTTSEPGPVQALVTETEQGQESLSKKYSWRQQETAGFLRSQL